MRLTLLLCAALVGCSDPQRRPYAFEYYKIWPYSKKRCVRIRFGWKIQGRKFTQLGDFAPLVFTINPFDGYGD